MFRSPPNPAGRRARPALSPAARPGDLRIRRRRRHPGCVNVAVWCVGGRRRMTIDHADGPVRKRGRRAHRPDPDGGPVAGFAHALLVLKETAGDPSYDRMRTEFGAVASKSALAAAARGLQLPSWETTW